MQKGLQGACEFQVLGPEISISILEFSLGSNLVTPWHLNQEGHVGKVGH